MGLSHHDPCNEQEDRVTIKWVDNWTNEPKSVCVQANTKEIHANSNTALVSFVTNSQLDSQGFRVFYSEGWLKACLFPIRFTQLRNTFVFISIHIVITHFVEWPCDAFLSKAPGEFASPDYPNNYPASTRCSWRLTAPQGSRVVVHFTGMCG